ncbi:MAG: hypothetical protein AAGK92_03085 [Pseudomonadota bacterium]
MDFKRISVENGEWNKLWTSWDEQCDSYGEKLDEYAVGSIAAIRPLANGGQTSSSGVYGLVDEQAVHSICQLNTALLPGYTGKVLRLRHLVLAPRFDYDDSVNLDEYVTVLSKMFAGAVEISGTEMLSDHIKLHLQSPADKEFFKLFQDKLRQFSVFNTVELRGAWLYISK